MLLGAYPGLTPGEVDRLSLRETVVMVLAARLRRREALWHTGAQLDYTLNYGGMRGADFRPVPFGYHFEQLTGGAPAEEAHDAEMRARLRAKALALRAQRGEA